MHLPVPKMDETALLTPSECQDLVRKCLKSENVQNLRFVAVRLQNQNFLLKITVNHDCEEKTLTFFAKSALKKPKIVKILFDDFKKAIPQFDPKITPKIYYGKPDLLLFEDLTWQGFRTHSGDFSLDHVEVLLRVLAKFHAGSFVYEEIKSKEVPGYRLNQDYKLVHSIVDLKKTDLISFLVGEEKEVEIVSELEEKQLAPKFRRTLCHGNLVSENIMFKYSNEAPIDCKLLNFKSKQYTAPGCDVLQAIFFNTSEELRQMHFQALLEHYYNCLEEELSKYSLSIEPILPRDEWGAQAHFVLPLIKLQAALLYQGGFIKEVEEAFKYPLLSRQDCYSIIRTKIGSAAYKFLSFSMTPLDRANGYLGTYHKLKIKILRENEETIDCFVKCMPKNESSKIVVEETGCFLKEVFIYQTLIPQMLQSGVDSISTCAPRCYFHRNEDLVVFDDLSCWNYRTLPAQIPFDLPLLTLVARKLAKFHASTIVLEERKSAELGRPYRLGEEYGRYLQEIYFLKEETHSGALLMQAGVRSILDVINLFPDLKKENQGAFNGAWPQLQEVFFESTKPSKRYRNVVAHGDLWTNNVMIQFDGDKPVDCRLVDFQITRYCPPAHDYLCLVYLTTDRATRARHEQEVRDVYYGKFGEVLASYGYSMGEILPLEDFLASVAQTRPQIVMQAIMYYMFIICTSEEISSILENDDACRRLFFGNRKDYLEAMCEKSLTFRNKLEECVLDLYDLCNSMNNK